MATKNHLARLKKDVVKRIGRVSGTLVPLMVFFYLLAGFYVLFANYEQIPGLLALMVKSAFSPAEATGAFIGGTAASAFMFGMKRAVFSNEAGQGSSAIAHAAAKTNELLWIKRQVFGLTSTSRPVVNVAGPPRRSPALRIRQSSRRTAFMQQSMMFGRWCGSVG